MKYQNQTKFRVAVNEWAIGLILLVIWASELGGFLATSQSRVASEVLRIQQPIYAWLGTHIWSLALPKSSEIDQQTLELSKAELADKLQQFSDLDQLRQENENLKAALGLKQSKSLTETRVAAQPVPALSQPKISLGSSAGVTVGALVFSPEGILLGRVSQVEKEVSLVSLLNSSQFFPVLAKTQTGVQGLVISQGSRLKLSEIPQEVLVKAGESVVTLGQEGIPPRLPLGVVADVRAPATAATQEISIDQLTDFYQLPVVMVGI